MVKECEICGDEFETDYSEQVYCYDCDRQIADNEEDDYDDYDKEKNVDTGE